MAVLVVAAAGAYVGAAVGIGAAAGWLIGSYLYSSFLAPGQKKSVRTSELNDLRVMGTEYGEPIAYLIGTMSVAGQMWWNSDRRPVVTTTTTTQGGKGGGGGTTTETTVTTYDMDALIGLCDNRIVGVSRIWDEGKLIYTAHPDSDTGSIVASEEVVTWDRMTVYTGDPAQMPDPTYEAAFGVGNVPAYRHRAYVFFEGLHLGQSGRVPNFTFEIVTDGEIGGALRRGQHGNLVVSAVGRPSITFDSTGCDILYMVFGHSDPISSTEFFTDNMNPLASWQRLVNADGQAAVYLYACRPVSKGPGHTIAASSGGWGMGCFAVMGFTGDADFTNSEPSSPATYLWGAQPEYSGITTVKPNLGGAAHVDPYPDGLAPWMPNQLAITALCVYPWGGGSNDDTSQDLQVSADFTILVKHEPAVMFVNAAVAVCYEKNPPLGVMRQPVWTWTGKNESVCFLAYINPPMVSGTTVNSETVTLEETVRRLLVRCGMVEGTQFDVSALASITRPVRALYISQVSPTRQTLDALASTYFFDMTVSDKLYFIPRGGAIAATIPYADLGAAFDGPSSDEVDPFILKNSGDLEFPARVSLVYRNADNDYQVDTQMSDRLVSASAETAKVITLPMVMKPGEAKQVADVMLFNQAVNMLAVDSIKVLGDYVALEPTDAVNVIDAEGNSYRLRLTSRRDEYPLLEYSAVLDDVSVLTSSGLTDTNYDSSQVVEAVPLTVDLLLDIPMLRDSDNDLGLYAVAKGATAAKWPGAVIYVSGDGVNYESQGAVAYANIFGTCTTTLGNWTRGRLIDEVNKVTVAIGAGSSLSSSTYERVLNNKTVNACLIGDELLQFIDAAAVSDGVYTLSRLLRGSLGTERVMASHGAGERFALLDPARLGRVTMPNTYLGVPLYYKFITVGRTLDSDTAEAFVNTGVNLKPVSPVYLRVVRDPASFDATITWERRSRFTVRTIGAAGINVPPDEVRWEIEVYANGTYASVVRTITATIAAHPSAAYSAVDQAADGLTPGNPLFVKIYPVSGTVGRGYPLTASA